MAKTLEEYKAIVDFLGDEMTEDQATRLMDDARSELSIADVERLKANVSGPMYTQLSMYEGEMGGFQRW